jgi:urease accessory protein
MNKFLFVLGLLASSPLAFAHIGHTDGFFEATIHPVLGWDHLLAMFMVGIVAHDRMQQKAAPHQFGAKSALIFPFSFMFAMAVGLMVSLNSTVSMTLFESVVLLSVFVTSLMVVKQNFLRDCAAMLGFILTFGFAHGVVHGTELRGDAIPLVMGMLIGTGLLHGAGFLFGYRLAHRPWAYKGAGLVGIVASAFSAIGALS